MDFEVFTRDQGTLTSQYIATLDNYNVDPDHIDYSTSEKPENINHITL